MHMAARPLGPGGMGMNPQAQSNGPPQGPAPMGSGVPLPPGSYMQQPTAGMPHGSTNGSYSQPGHPGPMSQIPMGSGPVRPPSANGYNQPSQPHGDLSQAAKVPPVSHAPRPGSSQGMYPMPPAPVPQGPGMFKPQPSTQPMTSGSHPSGAANHPGVGYPPVSQPMGAQPPRQMSQQVAFPGQASGLGPRPSAPVPSGPMGSGFPPPGRPQYPSSGMRHPYPGQPQQPSMGSVAAPPRPGMPPAPAGIPPSGGPPQQTPMMAGPPLPSMPSQVGPGGHPAPGMPPGPGGLSGPGMPPGPGLPPGPGMPPGPGGLSAPGLPPGPGMPPQPGLGYPSSMSTQPGLGVARPSPGRRTLDPDQMPSPIHVMEDDQKNNGGVFATKEKGLVPPLVTTKFVAQDYGNATPRFIRSTMYTVPATEDIRKQSGVPFAVVLTPLAKVAEGELEPPVSEFGPTGPVRCIRCKAYMCPFMQFIDGGKRFQCVFCKATTEVPADYFQHLDHTGMRIDRYQRPELCLGTYECLATKDYCRDSKEPSTPGIIFAIDVSYPMIKEGIVQLVCANIKKMLADLPVDPHCDKDRMRVGFMTYDKKINFYNIKPNLTVPQQLTVGDVDDMFVPLVDGLLCSVEEATAVIDSLLEQIPSLFAETRETETVLVPVIQAGKEAFKAANCAGKLIVFHHNLPVAEAPGKLKNRDDRKVLGSDKEKSVLTPQCKDYNALGQDCVGVGCTVDMFVFNNAYVDVATISQVCRLSGGQLYKYTYFQSEVDSERFLSDLHHNLSRPVVFDAIMRVRTSTGVRPVEFYGNFYMANTTDTELASINSDMAIACEIKYDDKLTEEDGVYIQAAVLFTSCSGQRRLRVINLSLNTSTSMADMYRNCELDTIINFQAKQAMQKLMESNPKSVKEALISNCAQILACYRKNCASPSTAGQLILPECMKLLPLYTNCLLKSDAISGGPDLGCDDRAFLMHSLASMDVASSVAFFYPRLIPLHDLNPNEENVIVPQPLRCSIEKVSDEGIYLLENGIMMFLYVGLAASPAWIQDVFGVQTAAQINVEKSSLEERDNPLSRQVRGIIELIRQQRPRTHMRLTLVRQREKLDILFRHFLCEDRTTAGGSTDFNFSYVDFLCHMHKEIRAILG